MNKFVLPWKDDYGKKFLASESEEGGSYAIVYPALKKFRLLQEGMSLLSIGGGSGRLEVQVALDYKAKIGFVDPSTNLYGSFWSRVRKANIVNQIQEKFLGSFQEFESKYSYDLIISIHSWYFIGCDKELLDKALGLMARDGKLLIVLCSASDWSIPLKRCLQNNMFSEGQNTFTLEDLSEWTRGLNYRYEILEISSETPLEQFIVNGEFTDYAKSRLAYHRRKEWSEFGSDLQTRCKMMILEKEKNGILHDQWGGLLFQQQ